MRGRLNRRWFYKRGDIYFADLERAKGSEQGGARPVVVLQNDIGNYYSPTMVVAPMTTRVLKKTDQPTHCILENVRGLKYPSIAMLEQILTIDKMRVISYMGKARPDQMEQISDCACISLGLNGQSEERIIRIMNECCQGCQKRFDILNRFKIAA